MKVTLELIEPNLEPEILYIGQESTKTLKTLLRHVIHVKKMLEGTKKDPVMARELPMTPWSTLEMDLFTLDSHSFLLVIDMTSGFPVIQILNIESCRSVLSTPKGVYCDFGLPKKN